METKTTPLTRTKSILTQNDPHSVRLMLWEGRSMEVRLVIHGEEEWCGRWQVRGRDFLAK